jgi:formamidopyrimidine-DNA glycosylase
VPEILEVERYRTLAEKALHRPIERVWMVDGRYGRGGSTPQRLRSALKGREFSEARRRGKLLLLDTDEGAGPTVGVRFGMTGGLVVDGQQALDRLRYGPGVFDDKWVRARVDFADGGTMQLHDPRRFGSLQLAPDEDRLGPDALSASLADVRAAVAVPPRAGPVAPLKARLMDQERLAGVGNLLADEILWRAGFDPGRRTPLDDDELRTLHKSLRSVLRQLDGRGGSHMGNLMAERVPGGHCPRDGAELLVEQVGGRTTYWCPEHQR